MAGPPNQTLGSNYSRLSQHIADLHFDSLHKQVCEISELLASDVQIAVTDAQAN
jgi:hypothetical protein